MSESDPLSRLRAGLDRDEAIAQAACDAARADSDGDVSRWFVDETEGRASAGVTSGYPQRVVGRPGGNNGVVVYDEGYPHLEQARHIARHDPNRVLCWVAGVEWMIDYHDALVKARAAQVPGPKAQAYRDGELAAYNRILSSLGDLYNDEFRETGEPR